MTISQKNVISFGATGTQKQTIHLNQLDLHTTLFERGNCNIRNTKMFNSKETTLNSSQIGNDQSSLTTYTRSIKYNNIM